MLVLESWALVMLRQGKVFAQATGPTQGAIGSKDREHDCPDRLPDVALRTCRPQPALEKPWLQPRIQRRPSCTCTQTRFRAAAAAASSIQERRSPGRPRRLDAGKLRWNEPLPLTKEVGRRARWMASRPCTPFPLEAATERIRVSDNSATNLLIKRLGASSPSTPAFRPWAWAPRLVNNWLPDWREPTPPAP